MTPRNIWWLTMLNTSLKAGSHKRHPLCIPDHMQDMVVDRALGHCHGNVHIDAHNMSFRCMVMFSQLSTNVCKDSDILLHSIAQPVFAQHDAMHGKSARALLRWQSASQLTVDTADKIPYPLSFCIGCRTGSLHNGSPGCTRQQQWQRGADCAAEAGHSCSRAPCSCGQGSWSPCGAQPGQHNLCSHHRGPRCPETGTRWVNYCAACNMHSYQTLEHFHMLCCSLVMTELAVPPCFWVWFSLHGSASCPLMQLTIAPAKVGSDEGVRACSQHVQYACHGYVAAVVFLVSVQL